LKSKNGGGGTLRKESVGVKGYPQGEERASKKLMLEPKKIGRSKYGLSGCLGDGGTAVIIVNPEQRGAGMGVWDDWVITS